MPIVYDINTNANIGNIQSFADAPSAFKEWSDMPPQILDNNSTNSIKNRMTDSLSMQNSIG